MTHYETLGVTDKATPEEIKAAFRKLAKQHHPDLGGDADKFQQINSAYEILSDPDKRAHYDYMLRRPQNQSNDPNGFGWEFNFNQGNPNDIFGDINDQFSQMFGFNFRHPQTPRNRNIRMHLEMDFVDTLDPVQKTFEYKISNGEETITIDLPAGIQDNTVFQLAGRGDNGNPAVPRGNLEIVVKVKPHPRFTRVDDHVLTEITIDCFQAIIGTAVELDTPRGKKIQLSVPAGIQNGTQLGITDEGFTRQNKTRGKLIVKINVMIPTALTKEQLNLVQHIQSLKPVNT
jgi:curved DNA-binding protein